MMFIFSKRVWNILWSKNDNIEMYSIDVSTGYTVLKLSFVTHFICVADNDSVPVIVQD